VYINSVHLEGVPAAYDVRHFFGYRVVLFTWTRRHFFVME